MGCPGRSIPAPPAAPGVAEFKAAPARSPAALGERFRSSTSPLCQKGAPWLPSAFLSLWLQGSDLLLPSCRRPKSPAGAAGGPPAMPGMEAPLHLRQDEPNSQAASGGASRDLVGREMEKEGAVLSQGARLHAVAVQDGPSPGSDMGLGTRELHIRLMERDRSR